MTVPVPDVQGQGDDGQDPEDAKPRRGFETDELPALYVALGVVLIAALLAFVAYSVDDIAVWPLGLGAVSVALGLWGGIRGAVGVGVLMIAIGGIVLTREWSLGAALLMNAVVVVACLAIMVGADLSFVMRRGSSVDPTTVQGLASVHVLALGLGIAASAGVVGVVEAISWPSWLIVVPIAGLTLAAIWLARWVRGYRASIRAVDAPVIGMGPVTPSGDSSWRQFKWQSGKGR